MIGYTECECMIYDASSLKEKRAVLQRVLSFIDSFPEIERTITKTEWF